jgi:hypothetical protein
MFCKHEWKLLSETTTESKVEFLKKLEISLEEAPYHALNRKFIQIVVCPKCNKLKRFVENI